MPAIAERLPAKYLVKAEAPKIIASREQHEAYIQRLLELQRKANRSAEETETAKLLVILIADYEGKQFTIEKASGVEVLRELMDANGRRQKDIADDLGGESIVSLILKEKRQLNRKQMEKLSHRFHVSPAVFFWATAPCAVGPKVQVPLCSLHSFAITPLLKSRKTRTSSPGVSPRLAPGRASVPGQCAVESGA
jgi:HTH-type transcriptional regulator/antitoxin HigA